MPTSVASGVLALRRGKAIGDSEVTAAERFARDYVWGVLGVRDPIEGPGGSSDPHNAQLARAEAIHCHRAVVELLGSAMTGWLLCFVVADWTFTAMAERFMPGRAHGRIEMRGRLTTLLTLLSQVYAAIDQRAKRADVPEGVCRTRRQKTPATGDEKSTRILNDVHSVHT